MSDMKKDFIYVNLFYNMHAGKNHKYFCKSYEDSQAAVWDGDQNPNFIMTLQLEKAMIDAFEAKQSGDSDNLIIL